MKNGKMQIGIIGCGGIANGKHLPALRKLPQLCELTAFCDIIPERAEKACREYGAEGAKTYTDYRELLKDDSIDVVHVLTPNVLHAPITVAALEAGKHVMCEKPMASTSADAQAMLNAWKKSGKKFTIGYQNRFRPEVQALYQACRKGELGEIYYAKALATRRRAVPTWGVFPNKALQGGGPLIDIGTHALDLTLWMMDNYQPKYCLGQTFHKLNKDTNQGNDWGNWDPEKFTVEDSAFGMVVMENGAVINLESSWALNTLETREAVTSVCGTLAGADMIDGLRINGIRQNYKYEFKPTFTGGGAAYFEGVSSADPSVLEAAQWIDAVINDKTPCVTPEQAFTVTRILEGIYMSAKNGDIFRF